MKCLLIIGLSMLSTILLTSPAVIAKQRVALVIGNSQYQHLDSLKNPVNDANAVAKKLKKMDFILLGIDGKQRKTALKNLTDKQLWYAAKNFAKQAKNADIAFIYYAGHGLEYFSKPYILPINMPKSDELSYAIEKKAISLDDILLKPLNGKAKLTVAIFDACRSIPTLKEAMRGSGENSEFRTMSRSKITGTQLIIAFAGAPGQPVKDLSGLGHSPYTNELLKELDKQNIAVETMLQQVAYNFSQRFGYQSPQVLIQGVPPGRYFLSPYRQPPPPPLKRLKGQGLLQVNVNTRSQIYLNNRLMGVASPNQVLQLTGLPIGQVTVGGQANGYQNQQKRVQLLPNRWQQVDLVFIPQIKTKPIKHYQLTVHSNVYGDWVEIDGKNYGSTKVTARLAAGEHSLKIFKNGYATHEQSIRLSRNKTIRVRLEKKRVNANEAVIAEQSRTGGNIWIEPTTGMKFVWVPKGSFRMGSASGDSDEKPVHSVSLDGFWMGQTEVTNAQYRKYKSNHDSKAYAGNSLKGTEQPAVYVSWEDAKAYAKWLSKRSGKKIRLPTEAQWEYACRSGGKDEKYSGGDTIGDVAWYGAFFGNGNSGEHTNPVKTKLKNGLGIYDMSGNVWEWVEDKYDSNAYSKFTGKNPVNITTGSYRVYRGGSWNYSATYSRCAYRDYNSPSNRYDNLGVRLARTVTF